MVEASAFLLSLICVFLNAYGHVLTWPFAMVASATYAWVFTENRLYGDAALQGVFIVLALYGWKSWSNKEVAKKTQIFSNASHLNLVQLLTAGIGLFILIRFVLVQVTNSDVPTWDAFLTAGSLIATYMSAKKWIENWLLWIVVDTIYIGLYIYKSLYLTALLYGLFVILCVLGWRHWKLHLSQSHD